LLDAGSFDYPAMLAGLVRAVQGALACVADATAITTQLQHEKRVYAARGRLYVPRNEKFKGRTP
jgi:uncharacterized integral membrane protein